MKEKKKQALYKADRPTASRLKELSLMPEIGMAINIRAAKAQLSALADLVEEGEEVVLTRDGKPVLRMVPFRSQRKPYAVNWDLLKSMPMQKEGPFAEELVREDRDGRGW